MLTRVRRNDTVRDLARLVPALVVSSLSVAVFQVARERDIASYALPYLMSSAVLGPLGFVIFAIPAALFSYVRRRHVRTRSSSGRRIVTAAASGIVVGTLVMTPACIGIVGGIAIPSDVLAYTALYAYGTATLYGALLPNK